MNGFHIRAVTQPTDRTRPNVPSALLIDFNRSQIVKGQPSSKRRYHDRAVSDSVEFASLHTI
jgi:hypothetical protein